MRAELRPTVLILAIVLLPLARVAAAAEPYTERSDVSFAASGIRVLELDNPRGSIRVRRSADGRIHLRADKICRDGSREKARDYARQTEVTTRRDGERFSLVVQYPRNIHVQVDFWQILRMEHPEDGFRPRVEVRLTAECPDGVALRLHTRSGDVSTEGLSAAQTIESSSGDVVVKDARELAVRTSSGDVSVSGSGLTRVETASGDQELVGATGALEAHSTSGTIVVTRAGAELKLGSASGDVIVEEAPRGIVVGTSSGEVRVRSAAGTVELTSASGDIRARLRGPLQKGRIQTTSGELWLDLAGGMDATLEAASSSGSLNCRVALADMRTTRHQVTGRFGRGGAPIQLRTASGDITVTSGGR